MGTRHLIAAKIDGDYRIAQYGQWDGYPEGQGARIIDFLNEADLDVFKTKLRATTFLKKEDIDRINAEGDWLAKYPYLSRDTGADILNIVNAAETPLKLKDTRGFAGDSLFCEFAYVVDFDANTFEVFKGFNKKPTPADSRFPSGAEWLEKTDGYEPVALVQSYALDCLPSKEGFLSDLSEPDEEDENEAA